MLMHLSLGIAAKVGGLENCRSRVDLQSLKSHSRAVYADMQIAQSCKSCSRANHAAAQITQLRRAIEWTRAAVYSKESRGSHSPTAHLRPPAHSHAAGVVENAASAESESKAAVVAGRA